jgi:vitamin K-dependent gamma-carboxylase
MTERLARALARPVDAAWLAAFRALFGLTLAVSMLRFIVYGWVDTLFVQPTFHFKYFAFEWVDVLPRAGMYALFGVLAALALLMALGLWFRVAAFGFALGFAYLQLIDVTTYLNHYYLANLLALLLAFSPAGRVASLDVLRGGRTPSVALTQVPAAWLYLFRVQVGIVYTFAGLAKAHADWLVHAQPLRIWLSAHTDMPVLGWFFALEQAPIVMSWAGFLFDTSIPWLLLVPRLRPYAYVLVIVFHTLTRLLFPIGMFAPIMMLSALAFFSPSWPRTALAWLSRLTRERWPAAVRAVHAPAAQPAASSLPRWAVAAFVAYCLVQAVLPLRFIAYGGDVRWHEQGMRFSWRVMVREKNGSVTFEVLQKSTGRRFYVSPHVYLTALQEREMSGQPDLVLQLAHHIRDDFARRGFGEVEVHADALVSFNGRKRRRLIDPSVDLAATPDGFARAAWILPAPPDPPARLRRI